MAKQKRRYILAHHRSPGDLVCMTALIRDIHLTYPGQFELDVNTTVKPIWDNNPYLTRLWNHDQKNPVIQKPGTKMITCQYGKGIREQNHETIHFCNYFHRDFQKQTGIEVPCQLPHGDIHLSEEEKNTPPVHGRYWLIMTGGKSDFTIKVWHSRYFQEVTDRLGEMGLGVVQSGATHGGHWHPKLEGDHVIDLVGWGGFREWLQQIYHAEGVICGVTGAMHIAAALHKPCVVIAGGREAWWWEAYVNENAGFGPLASGKHPMPHKFLHTIGLLDCCKHHGCWKNKVVPLGKDKLICKRPIMTPEMPIAECMQMITPDHVMEAVMEHYTDGTLPPIKVGQTQQPAVCKSEPCETGGTCQTGKCGPKKDTKKKASASIVIPQGIPLKINPKAKVNVVDQNKRAKAASNKPGVAPDFSDDKVIDHPSVGGKYTAFILFYGPEAHYDLHKRCLESFLATTTQSRVDLRVGSNALNPKSLALIQKYVDQGFITKHYRHEENDYKYPVMREMFFDPDHPITTKWVLWFDDDSICDVEPAWMNILSIHIAQNPMVDGLPVHMVGAKFTWTMNNKHKEVFKSRPWYTGRPWRQANGKPAPNGNKIIFGTGGFWAITHEAIIGADIPDLGTGLTHTGGDWQIGEQLYQAGYGLKQFNGKKQFVRTSSVDRRGVTMPTVDQVDPVARKVAAQVPQAAQAVTRSPHVMTPPPMTQTPTPPPQPPAKTGKPQQPKVRRIVEL